MEVDIAAAQRPTSVDKNENNLRHFYRLKIRTASKSLGVR